MNGLDLALRVGVALVSVLGLVWLASRGARRSGLARGAGVAGLSVVARHGLGRTTSVALVRLGDRALLLGVAEQHVSLLADLPAEQLLGPGTGEVREELELRRPGAGGADAPSPAVPAPRDGGRLDGSALSPATWRAAADVLRERTARR